MKEPFESATLKFTAGYLLVLMAISITFSTVIYQISSNELQNRLGVFESRVERMPMREGMVRIDLGALRDKQVKESQANLVFGLLCANSLILLLGGAGSYWLARWSLRPIEQSHEAQSRFTSDASHELRTPLAVMKSELEVALRSGTLSKSEMRELLESNLEEVNRLATLSQTLLQLSRYDQPMLEKAPLSLPDVVREVTTTRAIDASRIVIEPTPALPTVYANRASLVELIMILVDNALRYSPADSPVTIGFARTKQHLSLNIENTGAGIDEADLPHIFERFYRGDKSRTSSAKTGYGLGLSLAKKIAEVHNATIEITSEPDAFTRARVIFSLITPSQPKFSGSTQLDA